MLAASLLGFLIERRIVMYLKLICLASVILVLSLAGSVSAQLLPGWSSADVGSPTPGNALESGGTWEVTGAGNDIWGTSDNFHFVFQSLSGDGEMVARVVDNGTGSNNWAKGGVMIRQDTTGPSAYVFAAITGSSGNGNVTQWRDSAGASAAPGGSGPTPAGSPPYWVRIVREGDIFRGYRSADGIEWEQMQTDHVVTMTDPVLIGLAVTSHASGELRTFTFDNVLVGKQVIAGAPSPKNEALHFGTWVTLGWSVGHTAVSHDVYFGESFDDVNDGTGDAFRGNQASTTFIMGFPGFPYPDGLVPGTTYYWRIDEVEADGATIHKGMVWSFLVPPKTAFNPDPADGAEFVDPNASFSWTGGFNAKLHTVYMGTNFDDISNAEGGTPLGSASYSPGTLESEKVYYWRVDEFDPPFTHKGDIWGFTTPGAVGYPQPANGAADVQMIETLSWTAADNATSHELYFGTDAETVKNATTASPEYIGPRALGAESYDPGGLTWDSGYAWRVDEVYPAETVKGLVWSFATADFISVDDFEAYNDIDPPDPASNRIFDKWIDGFGTTTNGALVGNDLPPYAEQTIVKNGAQSMPYLYDNNLKTSEATLTLVYPRDWTAEGVTKLSLWFRGDSGNAAERMFVALGNAVVYHPDPAPTQMTGWNEWVIDLTEFAGVDLTNVNTITIGFGTRNSPAAGGTGTMYFDDIRLIR